MYKNNNITRQRIATTALAVVLGLVFCSIPYKASAQTLPAASPAGSSFEQRLAQRKAERAISLSEKDQKRILSTCVGAQTDIRVLQQKTAPLITKRVKLHQQMDAKLWIIIGKLKVAEKDTFELEKERATLAEKASAFQTITKEYQQSLDDAVVINCQADPNGFKVMLETAKIYRTQIHAQSTDIQNHVVNSIKPTLANFVTQLQVKPATEDN